MCRIIYWIAFSGPPVKIELNMYIKSLGPVSETEEVSISAKHENTFVSKILFLIHACQQNKKELILSH